MSLEQSDAEAAAVQKPGHPRVSLDDIKASIAFKRTFTAEEAVDSIARIQGYNVATPQSLSVLTICIVVMKNGFVVVGKSAPADAANFNAELGAKFAEEDCIRQLWPLMGYELRERLWEASQYEVEPEAR